MSAGKGSSPRPVNRERWDRNRRKIKFDGGDKAIEVIKTSTKTTYKY